MNYKEKWSELKERLKKAEMELLRMISKTRHNELEEKRLNAKMQGLRIAIEYMEELDEN
ncbi:hypothetical protein MUB23_18955 [Cuneatibacter sp. NSJ-177]|uniref:hypothetical protein n=1 Tax=Cuneatibacter sp. NSJ-177 TaxID=2931401 RepID=UPI001FD0D4D1|nr:hypothetical protein [Cuneatibacter sp. NSJ-177]MCJ7837462.1 hypothetical protein [Cuneatibacter sp. NSJ-177]